jgi:hypothetical protein
MPTVKTLTATTPNELKDLSGCVHDAYFEHEQVVFDEATRTVTVPFAQEGGQWVELADSQLPEPELLREKKWWRSAVYRVPLLRCEVVVHKARSVDVGPEDAPLDPGMLDHIEYDSGSGSIMFRTVTGPQITARVHSLRVDIAVTDAVALHVRRRHGLFGIITDRIGGDR